jgi:hypothetical protein
MSQPEPDATVRELVEHAMKLAKEQSQHIISLDFEPEDIGDHVMLVICVGKEARNSMARLLNTFMEFDGEGTEL